MSRKMHRRRSKYPRPPRVSGDEPQLSAYYAAAGIDAGVLEERARINAVVARVRAKREAARQAATTA